MDQVWGVHTPEQMFELLTKPSFSVKHPSTEEIRNIYQVFVIACSIDSCFDTYFRSHFTFEKHYNYDFNTTLWYLIKQNEFLVSFFDLVATEAIHDLNFVLINDLSQIMDYSQKHLGLAFCKFRRDSPALRVIRRNQR